MALSEDEKEVIEKLSASGEADFYAPLLAIALLRYDRRSTPFGVATEEVVKLVIDTYADLNEHFGE